MSEIIHKTEPIEYWIVDGKAYRLATEADVGKPVYRSDVSIKRAMEAKQEQLASISVGNELPYVSRGFRWRYAYIQDDSLLTPQIEHVVDCVTVEQRIAQRIMDDKAMKQTKAPSKPIDWTKPVRTKDGRAVRVLCTDGPGDYPVCGYIDGERNPRSWTLDGFFHINERHSTLDLENAPRRVKKTWWMNVFDDGSFDHYETKELADSDRGRGIFACVPFPIDCEEGEGL